MFEPLSSLGDSKFRCPVCRLWANEETLVVRCDSTIVESPFGEALVWTEIHKCGCGEVWSFRNSNV